MSMEEMEAMNRYRCVCGDTFSTRFELEAHCGCLPGVHEEAPPDEDIADTPQASPDAPGDAQAPVPDPMPGTEPAEAQSEDESVGVRSVMDEYERIKWAVGEAWALGMAMRRFPLDKQCSLCPCESDCDQERSCEEQIADVLWARAEAKA